MALKIQCVELNTPTDKSILDFISIDEFMNLGVKILRHINPYFNFLTLERLDFDKS